MALQEILNVSFNPNFSDNTEDLLKNEFDYAKSIVPSKIPLSLVNQIADKQIFYDSTGKKICINYYKGTTTLAFKTKQGIFLGLDSRATGGQFISSGDIKKYIPINKFLLGTMAGGAADCSYWERVLSIKCRIHELRNRERISVAAASKIFTNMIYEYKGMGLSLGVMICGVDKKGFEIYYVGDDGTRLSGNLFSVGSGSTYAYGILDSEYNVDLTDNEAIDLARKAIYHATYRDIASGGFVRVLKIDNDGWRIISEDDCKDLHYKYQDEKMH